MFSKAIVRTPSRSLVSGITKANLGEPDYQLALEQHREYVAALQSCDLVVEVMEADEDYPDAMFIEDTALLMPRCAIVTNPGAAPRQGEVHEVSRQLKNHYDRVEAIQASGTVEAGDIMMVGGHCYIGLSERTNRDGAAQMIKLLQAYGYSGSMVPISEALHLKSSVSYLENNNLVVIGELCDKPEFAQFNQIQIDEAERYAANCVWINNRVLLAKGFPKTTEMISALGYPVIELDVSEFRKLDGGLSCLSLRF
jgi:dimethylargininase